MTAHTPITFEVKGYNAKGICIDGRTYHTPKLNQFGGHWTICQRMAVTLSKNKKVKTIRFFMNDVEYVYSDEEYTFVKA